MPDSNTPWTPDEAFWDEAWADMDTRLARKRRKRLLLPLLLLLGLLGAGTLVLWPEGTPGNPDPIPALSAPAVAEENTAAPAPEVPAAAAADQAAGTLTEPAPPARIPVAASAAPAPAPAAPDPVLHNQPQVTENTPPPAANRPNSVTAAGLIPTLPLTPLDFDYNFTRTAESTQEQTNINPNPELPFTLEAGATTYPSSYLPGGYAQLTREIRGPGRWIIPVSFRYDYGRRWVTSNGVEDPQELLNPSNPATNLSAARARDEFRQPRELSTHALALRGGLGRRIAPRITLFGGLESSYLLGGAGPAYTVSDSSGVVTVTVTEERFRQGNFSGAGQMDMAAGGGGTNSTAILNPKLNRWGVSAWLTADYRLTGKLHLRLGTTRQLSPTYPEGDVRVERQRLELGLRWGG